MNLRFLTELLQILEMAVCVAALVAIAYRKQVRSYRFLAAFLAVQIAVDSLFWIAMQLVHKFIGYKIYFYSYWIGGIVESLLLFCLVYEAWKSAAPTQSRMRAAGVVMLPVAAALAASVFAFASGHRAGPTRFLMRSVSTFELMQYVLIIGIASLIVFVIRSTGLRYRRSRLFGVTLGLAIFSITSLAVAVLLTFRIPGPLFALAGSLPILIGASVWTAYFALPEPAYV